MHQMRSKSTSKLLQKSIPKLRNQSTLTKTAIMLSKVDILRVDIPKKDPPPLRKNLHIDHYRSLSGFLVNSSKLVEKTADLKSTAYPKSSNFKTFLQEALKEEVKESYSQQAFLIEKAKVSTKPYGLVRAYSANSHAGCLSANEDRICIVTNLTKTNLKSKQVSFFAVYDGFNGSSKADHMRDHFHTMLISDDTFWRDVEGAFWRTMRRIEKLFIEFSALKQPLHDNQRGGINLQGIRDQSSVSFAIVIVVNEMLYCFQKAPCHIIISKEFGAQIFTPNNRKSVPESIRRPPSRSAKPPTEMSNLAIELSDGQIDFICLASEGLCQNYDPKFIGRSIWLSLLKDKSGQLETMIGQANNCVLTDVLNREGASKNASMIVVGLANVELTVERAGQTRLPLVSRSEG